MSPHLLICTDDEEEDLARAMGIVGAPGEEERRKDGKGLGTRGSQKSKWGTVAGVSLQNTPIYVLEPKVN